MCRKLELLGIDSAWFRSYLSASYLNLFRYCLFHEAIKKFSQFNSLINIKAWRLFLWLTWSTLNKFRCSVLVIRIIICKVAIVGSLLNTQHNLLSAFNYHHCLFMLLGNWMFLQKALVNSKGISLIEQHVRQELCSNQIYLFEFV